MNHPHISPWTQLSRGIDRLRGRPIRYNLRRYERTLRAIDRFAEAQGLAAASDHRLRERTAALSMGAQTAQVSTHTIETFALVREAAARILSLRHFDVQMIAGLALSQGNLVEMQTGEGKTLAAVLPVCLWALAGQGVHVLTYNDYLARRDAEWMGPIYRFMGLSVGAIVAGMSRAERKTAYRYDVTYLTAKEAGYDFLRESLVRDPAELILRETPHALIDEVDSILIDEARIPLVIAGSDGHSSGSDRRELARLAGQLEREAEYNVDLDSRNVFLTDRGVSRVERDLACGDLHQPINQTLLVKLNQALHAHALLKRDVDYIVRDGSIEIVDEFTGRAVPDRHWPDGLHRAVEAKEHLSQHEQGMVLNSITMQHFLTRYPTLAGMTGTAVRAETEFAEFYGLKTVVIPPHRPCIRVDHPDVLFAQRTAKHQAIVDEVQAAQQRGQPVLIGTCSVEESESLERQLRERGIACQVLNARNDEAEAKLIAQAGAPRAVTVSTNMAGRGTDIRLGGANEAARDEVVRAGGLYVIGTNRHESRRIDRQLRGRAGRQGDPGCSRFFLSLEDDLLKRYNIAELIPQSHLPRHADQPLTDRFLHRKVSHLQQIVEGQNLDIRQTLYRYTSLIERQRAWIHARRKAVLLGQESSRLATRCPRRYATLLEAVGPEILHRVERQITLHYLDGAWTRYLADIADIKEGIYLQVVGGREPLQAFNKQVIALFDELLADTDRQIEAKFEQVSVTNQGIDLKAEGLGSPSSTWTYLINDNPFESMLGVTAMGNMGAAGMAGLVLGLHAGLVLPAMAIRAIRRKWRERKRNSDS